MTSKIDSSIIQILVEILGKYESSEKTLSPVEYIKYVMDTENLCLDEDSELCTYLLLDIYRFDEFLDKLLNRIIYTEDKSFFKVILYLILFKLNEETADEFYKAMIDYSQKFTKVILKFLLKKCTLSLLVAEGTTLFDVDFVANFIENFKKYIPLLREMQTKTDKYFEALNLTKIKPLTRPVTPSCMKYISKVPRPPPTTPSYMEKFRSSEVPRSTYEVNNIECNLEKIREKNKEKALKLQEESNKMAFSCSKPKDKKPKRISKIVPEEEPKKTELSACESKKSIHSKASPLPVKTNLASILREGARLQKEEDAEVKRIEEIMAVCYDDSQIEYLEAERRRENEEKELLNIKRKHIQGLLTFEEAAVAKERVIEANKIKRQKFDQEKFEFEKKIEEWKLEEEERIRYRVEKIQLDSKNARDAVEYMKDEKYQIARDFAEESKFRMETALAKRKAELEQKIRMIKELRALEAIKEHPVKEIDDTAISGLGLMTEMSLAELRERLFIMRIETKEEVERRQKVNQQKREQQKEFLKQTQEKLENYQIKKLIARKLKEGAKSINAPDVTDDIIELENKLKEKREYRIRQRGKHTY